MDFRRLTRQFILNEGKAPELATYLQSISEVLEAVRPRTRTDERRIEMAREQLREVRRRTRRLQERVNTLEEHVKILEENKEQ
jgi:DNA-binding transcriptional MerR regulator